MDDSPPLCRPTRNDSTPFTFCNLHNENHRGLFPNLKKITITLNMYFSYYIPLAVLTPTSPNPHPPSSPWEFYFLFIIILSPSFSLFFPFSFHIFPYLFIEKNNTHTHIHFSSIVTHTLVLKFLPPSTFLQFSKGHMHLFRCPSQNLKIMLHTLFSLTPIIRS